MAMSQANTVAMAPTAYALIEDGRSGRSLSFHTPVDIITAREAADVPAAFAAMQQAQSRGFWLAGYAAYELGYTLEPKLLPLLPPKQRKKEKTRKKQQD